jgi:hypothetical protein
VLQIAVNILAIAEKCAFVTYYSYFDVIAVNKGITWM